MKHCKLVEILSNLNVKPPLHERNTLPHKRKAFLATVLVQTCKNDTITFYQITHFTAHTDR